MLTLALGIIALVVFLLAARGFVSAEPTTLARYVRLAGGAAAVVVGILLALSGRAAYGLPLAFLGVSMLLRWSLFGMSGSTSGRPRRSRLRSKMLAVELDPNSGAVHGDVTSGAFAGRTLDSMDGGELAALMRELEKSDPDGVSLLEAYLNRRASAGREDFQRDARARHRHPPRKGPMTEDEAYEVLGLDAGAGPEEIRRAHRTLMKKVHPDQGGSDWLASRINQARDVLMRSGRRR